MDKLHELLNEFHLEKWERITIAWPEAEISEKEINALEATLISKKYWFIKWLVENEKIDYKKLIDDSNFCGIKSLYWWVVSCLLMLLSIKDEPLEFLASILK